MRADRDARAAAIRRLAARLRSLAVLARFLCFLRGHLPHRLREFVHGRTVSTCTRCGAQVRRGKNMRWETVR